MARKPVTDAGLLEQLNATAARAPITDAALLAELEGKPQEPEVVYDAMGRPISTAGKVLRGVGIGIERVGRNLRDVLASRPGLERFKFSQADWDEWNRRNAPIEGARFSAEQEQAHRPRLPVSMQTGDPETDARLLANLEARAAQQGPSGPGRLGSAIGETLATLPAAYLVGAPARAALGPASRLGARAAVGALSGAAEGSIAGALTAKDPGERLSRAVGGAVVGGGVGGALPLAGAGARQAAGPLSERLRKTAIDRGRKFLTGNAAPMSTRRELSEEAVQAAYDTGAIRPLGSVQKAEEKLWGAREALGDEYQRVVEALEAKGVKGPNAVLLARDLVSEAKRQSGRTLEKLDPGPQLLRDIAEEVQGKVNPTPFAPKELPLSAAENMKRTAQRAARADYIREGPESLAGSARTDLASRLRQAVEDSVAAQAAKAPAEAARFVPLKQQLGPIIEASDAASRAVTRAANRQTHGLGSKVLMAGTVASGNPLMAVPVMMGATAARNRGPATAGWIANALSKRLRPTPLKPTGPVKDLAARLAEVVAAQRAPVPLRLVRAAAEDEEAP